MSKIIRTLETKKQKTEMQDTLQLLKVCMRDKHLSKTFLSVFAGDQFPKPQETPCCYINNTDNALSTLDSSLGKELHRSQSKYILR